MNFKGLKLRELETDSEGMELGTTQSNRLGGWKRVRKWGICTKLRKVQSLELGAFIELCVLTRREVVFLTGFLPSFKILLCFQNHWINNILENKLTH